MSKVDASAPRSRQGMRAITTPPRSKWEPRFLAALAETSNVTFAAEAADITLGYVYKLRRSDPAFASRWYAALAEGYDNLEMELLAFLRSAGAASEGEASEGKRKFDVAAALRCLTAHRDSVAREKGRRTLADEITTIAAINRKIDEMRARALESDAATRRARTITARRIEGDGQS